MVIRKMRNNQCYLCLMFHKVLGASILNYVVGKLTCQPHTFTNNILLNYTFTLEPISSLMKLMVSCIIYLFFHSFISACLNDDLLELFKVRFLWLDDLLAIQVRDYSDL